MKINTKKNLENGIIELKYTKTNLQFLMESNLFSINPNCVYKWLFEILVCVTVVVVRLIRSPIISCTHIHTRIH